MNKSRILSSIEVTINEALKRLSILEGNDKKALQDEFKEWLDSINSESKNYDVLFIDKIN